MTDPHIPDHMHDPLATPSNTEKDQNAAYSEPRPVPPGDQEPEILQGDVGGDSISRDEMIWSNNKVQFDQAMQNLAAVQANLSRQMANVQAQSEALKAQLDAQTVQQRDQLFSLQVRERMQAGEREHIASLNAIHSAAIAQQQTVDHRDLAFGSYLPSDAIITATDARGSGRILAGEPDDVINDSK
jgi:hypothetical protein